MMNSCKHNARVRYAHGFYCEDCETFFNKDSKTYRSSELLSTLWMVMHNINARSKQAGGPAIKDALEMRDKIGIGKQHENYEELIAEAEIVMNKYSVTEDSATVVIK